MCVCVCVCVCARAQLCLTLQLHGLWPPRLPYPWSFPGQNTGVSCHFLLQGNFPNPGTKPVLFPSPAPAGGFFTTVSPGKPIVNNIVMHI